MLSLVTTKCVNTQKRFPKRETETIAVFFDIAILSVCLSVCLSVHPSVRKVPVLDENGLTYCHSFLTVR